MTTRQCDALHSYLADLGASDDVDVHDEDLLAHLDHCEVCRNELRRLRYTAAAVLAHRFDDRPDSAHLTELEIAVFAAHGLDAPNADEAVAHLSACRTCRRQFGHVRQLLEQHEDLIYGDAPRRPMPNRSFFDQVWLILSDPSRVLRAALGFFSWVLEWAVLVIVVFQMALRFLAAPDAITRSSGTEFLGLSPHDPLRFWLIAVACVLLAVFFRWLGAQLYHSAVEQER